MQGKRCRMPQRMLLIIWLGLCGSLWQEANAEAIWSGEGDGSTWADVNNWVAGALPHAGQTVTVPEVFTGVTITLPTSGTRTIAGLSSAANVVIGGGTLIITGTATFSGDLTVSGGGSLRIRGSDSLMTVGGAAQLPDGNIYAEDGAVIQLPQLTELVKTTNGNRRWEANGAGSRIELGNLSSITGRSWVGSGLSFVALAGGKIDLSSVTEVVSGTVFFSASGAGSEIDLSVMVSLNGYIWVSVSGFSATSGGAILTPQLETIQTANVTWDGTGVLDLSQVTSYRGEGTMILSGTVPDFSNLTELTNIRMEVNGLQPDFPLLANVDNSSFILINGAQLSLPLVTSYRNPIRSSVEWSANGADSRLTMANLLSLEGHQWVGINTDILALGGGEIHLPALAVVPDGAVWFRADGVGSLIELSSLESFHGFFWNTRSGFAAQNGGELATPMLSTVTNADFTFDPTGTFSTGQISTWDGGAIAIDTIGADFGALTGLTRVRLSLSGITQVFPLLANIDSSSLLLTAGAQLELPLVTAYENATRESAELSADGADSLLSLPNLVTLTGHRNININTDILARNGGKVLLPGLTEVPDGAVWFSATGADSLVDVSALTRFSGYFWQTRSGFAASSGGEVANAALVELNAADLNLDSGGSLQINQIESWTGGGTLNTNGVDATFPALHTLNQVDVIIDGNAVSFPQLSNINGSGFHVSGGSVLTLDQVTSYAQPVRRTAVITATGEGSAIHFPALTTATGHQYIAINVRFEAMAGGALTFPVLETVPSGAIHFLADGEDSRIHLPELNSFQGYFWQTLSGFEARNAGQLLIADDSGALAVRTGDVTVLSDGHLEIPLLELLADATLRGDGIFTGDVLVTTGKIAPGTSAGALTIAGDVTMGPGGRIQLDVGGPVPGTDGDFLFVDGHLELSGTLETRLINNLQPVPGDIFTLAGWTTRSGDFLDFAGLDAGANTEFIPFIDGNLLRVEAQFSSGPRIIEAQPDVSVAIFFDRWTLTFSKPIDRFSFRAEDVEITGPSGAVTVTGITRVDSITYQIRFAEQTEPGIYNLVVHPVLTDAVGNPLNQNANEINGEPEADRFLHSTQLINEPLPDLQITDLTAPASATSGEIIAVEWTVANTGSVTATAPWTTHFYLIDETGTTPPFLFGSITEALDLAAGASRQLSAEFLLSMQSPAGTFRILAQVDATASVREEDEDNNTFTAAIETVIPLQLRLTTNRSSFPESAGSNAATGRVTRNGPTTQPLSIQLTNSDPSEIAIPASVTIPVGQASVNFPIGALMDGIPDGDQLVTLEASASGYLTGSVVITVVDVDLPILSLTLADDFIIEGESTTATVSVAHPPAAPLFILINNTAFNQLIVPTSAIIKAGELSTSFSVISRDNPIAERERKATFSVSANGYIGNSATVTIIDDDLFSLTASFNVPIIAENAGSGAAILELLRDPVTSAPLPIQLTVDSHRLLVPTSVSIPANQDRVQVPLTPVDNDLIDGDATVTLTARVLDPVTGTVLMTANPVVLTILDDDGPALSGSLSPAILQAGEAEAGTLTLSRRDGTTDARTVSLSVSQQGLLQLPETVVFPNGISELVIPIATVGANPAAGFEHIFLTAEADGFSTALIQGAVASVLLPDMVMTGLSGPASVFSGSLFAFEFTLENGGLADAAGGFLQSFYLSPVPWFGEEAIPIGTVTQPVAIEARSSLTRAASLFAPERVGTFWLIGIVDSTSMINELDKSNNITVSSQPIVVERAYTATVEAGVDVAFAGNPIPLSGSATLRANGAPAANVLVNLHLSVQGTTRVFSVITNAMGQFSTQFIPLPREGGQYQIGAAHPSESNAPVQDSFLILGMTSDPEIAAVSVITDGSPVQTSVSVRNLSDVTLAGLQAGPISAPAGITATARFGTLLEPATELAALGAAPMVVEIAAGEDVPENVRLLVPVSTAEDAHLNVPIDVTVRRLVPQLVFEPETLFAAVVGGTTRIETVRIHNEGGAATGPLSLSLPASLPWIQGVSDGALPSIAPGEFLDVGILLLPPEALALGQYTGTIGISSANTASVLPFEIMHVSDAVGDLLVATENELTYYAEGAPRIANADVSLFDPFTGALVASGNTDGNGTLLITGIQEGYYELQVAADRHRTFRNTILVRGGRINPVTAFLPFFSISYNWTVVPTGIEDRYTIRIETVFETNLPIPVVTVEPNVVNLDDLTQDVTQIDFTLANHGLLAAENTRFTFRAPSGWTIQPLVEDIGILPAKSAVTIPVIFTRLAGTGMAFPMSGGGCGGSASWTVSCGGEDKGSSSDVAVNGGTCETATGGGGGSWGSGGGSGVLTGGGGCADGDDNCLMKNAFLCAIGFAPFPGACVPGVLDCAVNWNSSAPITSGAGCILAGASCIPGLNVPTNLVLCALSMALCFSPEGTQVLPPVALAPMGTLVGGDAVLLPTSGPSSAFDSLANDLTRFAGMVNQTYEFYLSFFGSSVWFNGQLGAGFHNWYGRFQAAADPDSEDAEAISNAERAALLLAPLPEGLTPADVEAFIERWQNTLSYAELGIFRLADLPDGWDPNFIAMSDLSDAAVLARAGYDAAIAEGYIDPFDALIQSRDQALAAVDLFPQESSSPVCARIRLGLGQSAVLTRDAFDANLEIINETGELLDAVEVALRILDADGADLSHLFQLRAPNLRNLDAVDGTGSIAPGETARVHWAIVPSPMAAPEFPQTYFVTGTLRHRFEGTLINVPLQPASIEVQPSPRLVLKYFHQRDVFSDDPETGEFEPPQPFSLAVMVENQGAGTARQFSITSAQPKIEDNEKGLAIAFALVAAQVDNQPITPTLTVNFGDIGPGQIRTGQWFMTSSLQGLFTSYEASFEHLDANGDPRFSLIESVEIHEMLRPVRVGAHETTAFLANTVGNANGIPDSLHVADGSVLPVSVALSASFDGLPTASDLSITLTTDLPSGWGYLRVPDPADGQFILVGVTDSDGIALPTANFWQTDRTFPGRGRPAIRENLLHLVADVDDGVFILHYVLPPDADLIAPTSTVSPLPDSSPAIFRVAWQGDDDVALRDFTIFVSTNSGPFVPWLTHTSLTEALFFGEPNQTYAFYSIARDVAGNVEAEPASAQAVTTTSIANNAPSIVPIADVSIDEGSLFEIFAHATDPDAGQRLRFSITGQPPAGMTINPTTGRLSWQTSELDGGTTVMITVVVTDDGQPPLQDSTTFQLSVIEVNNPPVVAIPQPRTVAIGELLQVQIVASDIDIPAQTLTFALAPDAPAAAAIDPLTGWFTWTPALTDIGNNDISVAVSDGIDTTTVVLPVLVTLPQHYHAWKEQFWPGINDLAIIGFDADPDGDGVTNLVEYALGTDPTQPSAQQFPAIQSVMEGDRYLSLTFYRPRQHQNFSYQLQASNTLHPDDWQDINGVLTTSSVVFDERLERVRLRDIQPQNAASSRFLRLKVTENGAGDSTDSNGNGIPDLLEHAFGAAYLPHGVPLQPTIESVLLDGISHLRITFIRRIDDPRLRIDVLASNDLHSPMDQWQVIDHVISVSVNRVPVGFERVVIRDTADSSTTRQRFVRLRMHYEE